VLWAAFGDADPTGPRNYYRARYYDPQVGRFTSEDPGKYDDGLNMYAYVGSDPTNAIDPSGLVRRAPQCGATCPPDVTKATENLCANTARAKIPDWAVRRCVRKKCESGIPITCGGPECSYTTPIVYGLTAPDASSIMICPNNTAPGGCHERTIAHEMMHTCRRGGPKIPGHNPNDDFSRQVRDAVRCPFP
jgi:RHS repeat-associated protein